MDSENACCHFFSPRGQEPLTVSALCGKHFPTRYLTRRWFSLTKYLRSRCAWDANAMIMMIEDWNPIKSHPNWLASSEIKSDIVSWLPDWTRLSLRNYKTAGELDRRMRGQGQIQIISSVYIKSKSPVLVMCRMVGPNLLLAIASKALAQKACDKAFEEVVTKSIHSSPSRITPPRKVWLSRKQVWEPKMKDTIYSNLQVPNPE